MDGQVKTPPTCIMRAVRGTLAESRPAAVVLTRRLSRVRLEITRVIDVPVPQTVAWALLSDVPRLSACIPKVSNVQVVEAGRHYTGIVADKLGPFSLTVPVRIEVQDVEPPRHITAEL